MALVLSVFLECFSVQISVLSLPFLSQASLFDESCFDESVCKFYNKGSVENFHVAITWLTVTNFLKVLKFFLDFLQVTSLC